MLKLSIIVPVYNVEKYLAKCLDSICSQLNEDTELICVNDSSTDDSAKVLEDYQQKYHFTVLHNEHNKGLAESRNVGMAHAVGKYIWFVDSDDFIEEGAVNRCIELVESNQLDVLAFDSVEIYGDNCEDRTWTRRRKTVYDGVFNGKEMLRRQIESGGYRATAWQAVYRRDFLTTNNITFIRGIYHEDEWFAFLVYMNAQRAMTVSDIMYIYRRREGSISIGGNMSRRFEGLLVTHANIVRYLKMIQDDTGAGMAFLLHFEKSIKRLYNTAIAGNEEYADFISQQSKINQYMLNRILFAEEKKKETVKEVVREVVKTVVAQPEPKKRRIPQHIINDLLKTDNLYLYGAGIVADKMIGELAEFGVGIRGVVVTRLDTMIKKNFYGHAVAGFEQMKEELKQGVVLLAVSQKLCGEIIDLLNENEIKYINVYEENPGNE